YLDSIPPVVSHSLLGDQYRKNKDLFVSDRTTAELSATDNKAGVKSIRYFLNSKSGEIYSSPFAFPKKNGKLSYSYSANDNVLNKSKAVQKTVIVDISSPKITPSFKGEHYFSRKTHYIRLSTMITLPTTDNLSGVKSVAYTLNADSEVSYQKPFAIKTEGEHSLAYTASDNVNNIINESIKLYVDEKAPEIYHHFGVNPTVPAEDTYPLKSLLYLAATDKQSGIRNIYYSINGNNEIKYVKPLSFNNRMAYTIKIRAIDNVGNVSTSSIGFKIK
ncbi:hypothetical protein KKA14_04825, partial [bacterium]|nr:hypothetical protein [bacterium]